MPEAEIGVEEGRLFSGHLNTDAEIVRNRLRRLDHRRQEVADLRLVAANKTMVGPDIGPIAGREPVEAGSQPIRVLHLGVGPGPTPVGAAPSPGRRRCEPKEPRRNNLFHADASRREPA